MEDRNAWFKDWGKLLRESFAVSECGPSVGKIQWLLNDLEKRETHAARDAAANKR